MSAGCFVIAIDGPSGAGKSTTAKSVASILGYHYLDSGALYRAVGLAALRAGVDPSDEVALEEVVANVSFDVQEGGSRILLDGVDVSDALRSVEVGEAASKASACSVVRRALIELQRSAVKPPGAVVEGRDMGTVVFPDADLKVFLDADADERTRRRAAEMGVEANATEFERVRRSLAQRDSRDRNRALAPLKPAPDALIVDSTRMSPREVADAIVEAARSRESRK